MGRGASLATTEDHCSDTLLGPLGNTGLEGLDGRTLLNAASGSEIEMDEAEVDLLNDLPI